MNGASHGSGPLKIIIVGAGIGGLTAAIALRQQGHEVTVLEQSQFASEAGAAVHLQPNANGVLRRLGIFAEDFGANPMRMFTEYLMTGEKTRSVKLEESNEQWQHPWHLAHRVQLHNALKRAATSTQGKGEPVRLLTASRVKDVDPEAASVTIENGSRISGDLVVGADGVHSVTRSKIPGGQVEPFCCGKSAFRFTFPRSAAADDPATSHFVQEPGNLLIWYGSDRRVIMSPTSHNQTLNFVCVHPEAESEGGDDWNQGGSLNTMLEIYKDFHPALLKLLSKADPGSLKVWKLLDMEVLPLWTNQRLALLGDAAHPFLPHQGQGAGVAIEDGAALAVLLPGETTREDVPERLKLYEIIRYERANKIQEFSRIMGADDRASIKRDMMEFTNYNMGHDEWDNATQRFREWEWDRSPNMYWRMPVAFGPMPGPRQSYFGTVRQATESTFTTASVKFKTSRTVLQNLFPRKSLSVGWRFKEPGTVAYASFSQTTLNKMEWLGGSGYKHIGLYIHGVEYQKKSGEVVSGAYMPILFESLTDPIVSGREEPGMPKLYTSIDVHRRANSYRVNTGWQGAMWGNFTWEGLEEVDMSGDKGSISGGDDAGILVYRYIPQVGRGTKGQAEASYPVYVPFAEDVPKPTPRRVFQAGKAHFKIDPLDWDALPTLHHVISRLAEIPVYEIMSAKIVEGVGVPDVSNAQRVE